MSDAPPMTNDPAAYREVLVSVEEADRADWPRHLDTVRVAMRSLTT